MYTLIATFPRYDHRDAFVGTDTLPVLDLESVSLVKAVEAHKRLQCYDSFDVDYQVVREIDGQVVYPKPLRSFPTPLPPSWASIDSPTYDGSSLSNDLPF